MGYRDRKIKEKSRRLQSNGSKRLTTRGLMLGKPEAENENLKGEWYYGECFDWFDQIEKGNYIFIGRKGVGKSAIVRHICEEPKKYDDVTCRLLNDRDFELESILQNSYDNVHFLYEWIILTHLADCIVHSNRGGSIPSQMQLKEFLDKNRGRVEITKMAVKSVKDTRSGGIDGSMFNVGRTSEEYKEKAIFFQYIQPLREAVITVLNTEIFKDYSIYLLFDDLDKDFSLAQDNHKQRIIELVRVTKEYNTQYLKNSSAFIILFIRDDVYRETRSFSNDSAKIYNSASAEIKWYDHDKTVSYTIEKETHLRKFFNKRLKIAFEKQGIDSYRDDPWISLVDEASARKTFGKSAFKYILDLTFYRPRDLLLFFNKIDEADYPIPLSPTSIKDCAKRYLDDNMAEIKSELAILYTPREVDKYVQFLRDFCNEICLRASDGLRKRRVEELLKAHHLPLTEFDRLLSYWLIVPYMNNEDKLFFPYREQNLTASTDECRYKLPRSIFCYFRPESL